MLRFRKPTNFAVRRLVGKHLYIKAIRKKEQLHGKRNLICDDDCC